MHVHSATTSGTDTAVTNNDAATTSIPIPKYVINVTMSCSYDSDCLPLKPNGNYRCIRSNVCSCEEFGVDPAEIQCTPGE